MDQSLRALLRELAHLGATNDAHASDRQAKMLNITPDTGEFLAILVQSTKAKCILEIGTSNGYSTLWLADAARAVGGRVVTIESAPAKAEMARQNFQRASLSDRITQEITDGGEFLHRQPPSQFNLVFLDSDRRQYTDWWPWLEKVLLPGGLLVADNAVSHAQEMAGFIAQVAETPGWRSLVIPVGNGELVALKPI